MVKKCGMLRDTCGMFLSSYPQCNQFLIKGLQHLRDVAGSFLYPRVRSTLSSACSTCVYRSSSPKLPATTRKTIFSVLKRFYCMRLPLRDVLCFEPKTTRKLPADYPQTFDDDFHQTMEAS